MVSKTQIFLILLLVCFASTAEAQCAMCRAVLETEAGGETAKGINDGIVYLMSIPYILVGSLGAFIYFKYFRSKKSE